VALLVVRHLENQKDYFQRVAVLASLKVHQNQTDYFQTVVVLASLRVLKGLMGMRHLMG
jgi:hypothetical protein